MTTEIARSSSSSTPSVEVMVHAGVPRDAVDRPLGRLFVLLCERYDLDPALKQLEVIPTRNGLAVYITADGYRHIALASGMLDGITIADASEGEHGWRAHVQVWRKGCAHPFDGRAGCGFTEGTTRDGKPIVKDDPEAIAITRATRRALRNAFDPVRVEAQYAELLRDSETEIEDAPAAAAAGAQAGPASAATGPAVDLPGPVAPPAGAPATPGPAVPVEVDEVEAQAVQAVIDSDRQREARVAFNQLGAQSRTSFRRRHGLADMADPWPESALVELLGRPGEPGA